VREREGQSDREIDRLIRAKVRRSRAVPAHDRDDVAQDAAYDFYRHTRRHGVDGIESVSAYVDVIVRRAVSRYVRRVRSDPTPVHLDVLDQAAGPATGADPVEIVEQRDLLARVRGALHLLSEEEQAVVRAAAAGVPTKDVAARLGLSTAATRQVLHRGRKKLRRALLDKAWVVIAVLVALLLAGLLVERWRPPTTIIVVPRGQSTWGIGDPPYRKMWACREPVAEGATGDHPAGAVATVGRRAVIGRFGMAVPVRVAIRREVPDVRRFTVVEIVTHQVSRDGRNQLLRTTASAHSVVTVAAPATAYAYVVTLPCVDRLTGEPVTSASLVTRIVVRWADADGGVHAWLLPDAVVDLQPDLPASLPVLRLSACARVGDRTFRQVINTSSVGAFIEIWHAESSVTSRGGLVRLTLIVHNSGFQPLSLSMVEGRWEVALGSGGTYRLARGAAVAVPVDVPLRDCRTGKSVSPGTYVMTIDQADDRLPGRLTPTTNGLFVTVP
jgi:RNA polymerase sigma factor (sigma-70 family)